MQTPIGRALRDSRRDRIAACCVTLLVIGGDFAILAWVDSFDGLQARWALALVALAAQVSLVNGDLASAGLRIRPVQGWRYWVRMTVWIAVAVGAIIAVSIVALRLAGHELPIYTTSPAAIGRQFLPMCVYAPLLEETLYRFVLCIPLAAALGFWPAIAVSGLAFGALHVVYGNPSPENLFGGWFLAWAYLKSGAISIPFLLHSGGNLLVLASQVAAWYWMNGG